MKKIILTTLLTAATMYASSQTTNIETRRTQQTSTKKTIQTTQTTQTTPQERQEQTPTQRQQEQTLEQIIDLGRMSVGDEITNFQLQVSDEYGALLKEPRPLLYEGKKIGELTYEGEDNWTFNETIKDLPLGANYFKTQFVNELGLKTDVALRITTTNQPPISHELNYVFETKDGESRTGTATPILIENEYIYNLGEIHGRYSLSELLLKVTDEDENLIQENIFLKTNNVITGKFELEEENKFKYAREDTQNRGLGTYQLKTTFEDKEGERAPISITYKKVGEPPEIKGVQIKTLKGIEINTWEERRQ